LRCHYNIVKRDALFSVVFIGVLITRMGNKFSHESAEMLLHDG
jgi:hypothetical protein